MPSISTVQPLHSATTSCCSRGAGSAHQGWNPESRAGAAPSSATLGSLLTLFASLYDRNSPFTARRSRKGNSQALQVLFYCLYWVQSLVRGLRRRKVMKKKISSSIYPALKPRVVGGNISQPVPFLTASPRKQRHSAGAGM